MMVHRRLQMRDANRRSFNPKNRQISYSSIFYESNVSNREETRGDKREGEGRWR